MQIFDILGQQVFGAFFGRNEHYKTPQISWQNALLGASGQPEFLNPDNLNPYLLFMTTPQLYSVINRRGYLLASGVWKHYRTGKDGKPELVENSPYVSLLENPNPLMNGNDLIRQWNENKCLYGNNYEYVLRPFSTSIPSALTNIPPTSMEIKTTGKIYKQSKIEDIIEYYRLVEGGAEMDRFSPSEINHTRIVNSQNPLKGESPLKALYMPLSNIRSAYQFRNVIMTKRGALGILSNKKTDSVGAVPLTTEERQEIEKSYSKKYGIGDDQMQTILTSANVSYEPMAYPTKQLMLFEEVDANFRDLIDAYGMNDNLFSREKGTTFTNLAEALKQVYQSTIIPEAEELSMNRSMLFGLVTKKEWLELDYSHIPILQENEKEKAEVRKIKAEALTTLQGTRLYTDDELRTVIEL